MYARMCGKTFHDVPSFQNLQIMHMRDPMRQDLKIYILVGYSEFFALVDLLFSVDFDLREM